MVEENERRVMEGRPSCVCLQCLRCGSEFTQRGGKEQEDRGRLRGWAGLEEQEEERKNKCREDGMGERGTLVQEHTCTHARDRYSYSNITISKPMSVIYLI